MKKSQIILLLLLFGVTTSFSQTGAEAKRDYQWVSSAYYTWPDVGIKFDFNSPVVSFNEFNTPVKFDGTSASICDTNGDLLFFTNGLFVANKNGNIMAHGDSMGYGNYYNSCVASGFGMGMRQGAIILPLPWNNSKYCIIHQKVTDDLYHVNELLLTIVDMNENDGLGDVILKNQLVFNDSISIGGLTSVMHTNGKDWWFLIPGINNNIFYRFLLDSTGMHQQDPINIGFLHLYGNYQAMFSPDGTKYAITGYCPELFVDPPDSIIHLAALFDFNRTNGLLSNYRDFSFHDPNTFPFGFNFSPNSRFLYVMSRFNVLQWDTDSPIIPATLDTVAEWDGFTWSGFAMVFSYSLLAPDGKIYSAPVGPYIHSIELPDLQGSACHVVQHDLVLSRIITALPNFPNFRLGTTMTVNQNPKRELVQINAIPNPSNSNLLFDISITNNQNPMQFEVFNNTGMLISKEYYAPFQSVVNYNVSELAKGMYFAFLKDKERIVGKVKFVVFH